MIMKVVTIHTKVSIRATCCSPGWTMILYTHRRCLEVALRVISLRSEIWSLSGHGGHRSSRTDQARLVGTLPNALYGSPHLQTRPACKAGGRGSACRLPWLSAQC